MPAQEVKRKSKYALKKEGKRITISNTKPRRRCSVCLGPLAGRKGHGFPTPSGRQVVCGGCKRP